MTIVPHREISRITKERWQRGSPSPLIPKKRRRKLKVGGGKNNSFFIQRNLRDLRDREREKEDSKSALRRTTLQSLCVPLSVESGEENCRLSRSSVPRPTYGAPNRNVF